MRACLLLLLSGLCSSGTAFQPSTLRYERRSERGTEKMETHRATTAIRLADDCSSTAPGVGERLVTTLLFDMDGTLSNSEACDMEVFTRVLSQEVEGMEPLTPETYGKKVRGQHNSDIFAAFLPGITPEETQRLADTKEGLFREYVTQGRVDEVPGAVAFLQLCRKQGYRMGCVTNAARLTAEAVLASLGCADLFEVLVIGDECDKGKPAPHPYLRAAELMQVSLARTVVFEDSPSGVRSAVAAKAAGVVGLRSSLSDPKLKELGCTLTLLDFEEREGLQELRRGLLDLPFETPGQGQ